jgi:hypothetical protein
LLFAALIFVAFCCTYFHCSVPPLAAVQDKVGARTIEGRKLCRSKMGLVISS